MKARIELIFQGRPRAAPSSHLLVIMKNTPSRKQLRTEQKAARKQPCAQRLPADVSRLVPNNSYGAACKQFYEPVPFRCMDCGKEEIWTARQQKRWYEDCQGRIYSTTTRCLPCRIARRQKLADQRCVQLRRQRYMDKYVSAIILYTGNRNFNINQIRYIMSSVFYQGFIIKR